MQLFNVLSVSLFAMAIGLSPLSVAGEAIEPTIPDPWPSIQVSTLDFFLFKLTRDSTRGVETCSR